MAPGARRGLGIDNRLKLFIFDGNKLDSVLGFGAGARDNGSYCLALPACPIDGNCILGSRFEAFQNGTGRPPTAS